jgi:TonB family protein
LSHTVFTFATVAADGTRRRPRVRAALVAGCVLSVALHALLLASAPAGILTGRTQPGGPALQVALSASTARDAPFALLPDRQPLVPGHPRYARMLPFAPPIEPPIEPPFDERAYVPVSRLSTQPTPVDEIRIPYPRGVHHLRVLTVALTLFIDEDGRVENVRVENPELPQAYERAAIEAFAQGRFHPGLDGERPVKSRLRIRVAFDSGDSGETMLAPLPRTIS